MSKYIRRLALFSIVLDNLYIPVNLGFDFRGNYVIYFIYIVYFFLSRKKTRLTTNEFLIGAGLVILFTAVPILRGEGITLYLRQFVLISFNTLFAFLLINDYKFDIETLFRDYIKIAYFISIVGIVQVVSKIIGFRYGADYSWLGFDMGNFYMELWTAQAWFQERSFYAIALLPAIFVAIARLFGYTDMMSRKGAYLVLFALVISLSSVGLLGFVIAIVLIALSRYSVFRYPHILVIALGLATAIAIGFYQIPDVKLRVDDSSKLFFSKYVSKNDIERTNVSTYALFSNFRVALGSFADHPVLGTGLGTYENNYDKYIWRVLPKTNLGEQNQLNRIDANSLFLRLLSEGGLAAMILLALFLIVNRIRLNVRKQSMEQLNYWAINNAVLVLIFLRLLRQGHYTLTGFMLFILVYYYSKKYYPRAQ